MCAFAENHFKSVIYLTPAVLLNRHHPTLNWRVLLEFMTESLLNNISKFIKLQERKCAFGHSEPGCFLASLFSPSPGRAGFFLAMASSIVSYTPQLTRSCYQ